MITIREALFWLSFCAGSASQVKGLRIFYYFILMVNTRSQTKLMSATQVVETPQNNANLNLLADSVKIDEMIDTRIKRKFDEITNNDAIEKNVKTKFEIGNIEIKSIQIGALQKQMNPFEQLMKKIQMNVKKRMQNEDDESEEYIDDETSVENEASAEDEDEDYEEESEVNSEDYETISDSVESESPASTPRSKKKVVSEETKMINKFTQNLGRFERKYFKELKEEEKIKLVKLEDKLMNLNNYSKKPMKFDILDMDLSEEAKAFVYSKYITFQNMEPGCSDHTKLMKWFDLVVRMPFGKYTELPVSKIHNDETIQSFLKHSRDNLDKYIYGNDQAKNTILEIITQWVSNPDGKPCVIGLEGEPGVGKTTFSRYAVANTMSRPFYQVNLGGANESCYLNGSSIVYEGSCQGEIVNILTRAQTMNPVIYFDELDKVSDTRHGREIIGVLTHLTDYSQNTSFKDKYLDLELDLSKCLFIFSFNHKEIIDPILLDRMKIIKIESYKPAEKQIICQKYLLPDLMSNIGLSNVVIKDSVIEKIIAKYSSEKSGMREIRRCLEKVLMKFNYEKYMTPENINKMKKDDMYELSEEYVMTILKKDENKKVEDKVPMMYN